MIKKLFMRKQTIKNKKYEPITYKLETVGWGDAIHFLGWKQGEPIQSVSGWKTRKPEISDLLEVEMESGRIAIFEFIETKYFHDPKDMFFGKVKFVGYKDEICQ